MTTIDPGFIAASNITTIAGLRAAADFGVMYVQVPVIFTQGAWYVGTSTSARLRIERMVEEAAVLRVGLKVLVTNTMLRGTNALKQLRYSLRAVRHTIYVTRIRMVKQLRSLDENGVHGPVGMVLANRTVHPPDLKYLAENFVTLSIDHRTVHPDLVARYKGYQRIGIQISVFPITTVEEGEQAWERFQRGAILITSNPEVFMRPIEGALELSTA